MTVAERDELLDAVERVEREAERPGPGPTLRDPEALLAALADLIARAVRIWLVDASSGRVPSPPLGP
jgi:hypothetical protein